MQAVKVAIDNTSRSDMSDDTMREWFYKLVCDNLLVYFLFHLWLQKCSHVPSRKDLRMHNMLVMMPLYESLSLHLLYHMSRYHFSFLPSFWCTANPFVRIAKLSMHVLTFFQRPVVYKG